ARPERIALAAKRDTTDGHAEGAQALAATLEDARRGAPWNYQDAHGRNTRYRRPTQNPGWRDAPKEPEAPARSAPATGFDPALFAQQLTALMGQLTNQLNAAATRADKLTQSAAPRGEEGPSPAAPRGQQWQRSENRWRGRDQPARQANVAQAASSSRLDPATLPSEGEPEEYTNSDSDHETVEHLDE
ncbi:hypothetical protein KEM52_004674, partial [Ascosphaera acerosa]